MSYEKLFAVVFVACVSQTFGAQTTSGEKVSDLPTTPQVVQHEPSALDRYRPWQIPSSVFTDSPRLNELIRAGNLYLSIRDAIFLALENNLDVELQRLTPLLAEADLQRARAGGVLRGVPAAVREGPGGIGGQSSQQGGIAGFTGTQSQQDTSGTSTGASTVPAVGPQTTATGPAVPVLGPALVGSIGWNKSNAPQLNTFITGTNALAATSALGDLSLQKGFLSGGVGSIGIDSTRLNTNNQRSDINPAINSGLAASFTQPLLQGFGVAVNNRYIRIARNNKRVSDLLFEQQVITTAYTVARLYWDLVSLNGELRVQRQSLGLAEKLLEINVEQEEAGTVAPIEVVRGRAEVARARRDLTVAETRVRQQETILKDYLTRSSVDAGTLAALRVIPTDTISPPPQTPVRPAQDLIAEAQQRRPELLQSNLEVENSKITLDGSRSGLLPRLDLVVSARTNALYGTVNSLPPAPGGTGTILPRDPSPTFLGGVSSGLSQIFTGRFPDYGAELRLNIPLINRTARADYARDQLALRQQQIRRQQLNKQVRVDVANALIAVEQSRAALEAAQQARVLQEQSLEAERERYAVGASTNYLLIQYQRDLGEAQSGEVSALSDYAKAQAALDRATGHILDTFGISIADAFRGQMPASKGIQSVNGATP